MIGTMFSVLSKSLLQIVIVFIRAYREFRW